MKSNESYENSRSGKEAMGDPYGLHEFYPKIRLIGEPYCSYKVQDLGFGRYQRIIWRYTFNDCPYEEKNSM